MISLTSEDLPLPDTPVTTAITPSGMFTSRFLRLCARAPLTVSQPEGCLRRTGTGMPRRPDRYAPVIDSGQAMISCAVPWAIS